MGFDDISTEMKISDAMFSADMAWWEMELPSGAVFFHPNKAAMLGYSPDKFVHYTHFTDLLHPEDHEAAMKAMMDHMTGKSPIYETKYRIKHADGTYKTFYDKGKIVQKRGDEIRIAGVVVNVGSMAAL